jgi:hypothetical protein
MWTPMSRISVRRIHSLVLFGPPVNEARPLRAKIYDKLRLGEFRTNHEGIRC